MRAEISRALLARLLAEAAASPEREVCGLLVSRSPFALSVSKGCPSFAARLDEGRTVLRQAQHERVLIGGAIAAANVSQRPADSFEIDPAALFAAHRAERAGGPRVVGHYHSHPHGAARPSARDAAAATEPGRLWLILGENTATLWRAVGGGPIEGAFEPVRLETVPEAGCAT